jgi:hypothetical protein
MSRKLFNIRQALESDEPILEVEKEAMLSPEDKAIRDSAKQVMEVPAEGAPEGDAPVDPDAPAADGDTSTDATPVEDPDKVSPEGEEGTPTDVADVDQDVSDLNAQKADKAEAVGVAEALESLADNMYASLESGGLSTTGFRITELSLKAHFNKLGLSYEQANFPAMESFDSYSARYRQTKVAIEAIDEAVNKVWQAIKESLVRMIDNVKAIFSKLLFMFKTYETQIKALRAALGKVRLDEPKRDTYSNNSVIRNLSMGKTFDPDSSLVAVAGMLDEVTKQFKRSCPDNLKTVKETFAASVYTDKLQKLNRLKLAYTDIFPSLKKRTNGESDRTVSHYTFSELPGSMMIVGDLPKEGLSDEDYLVSLNHSYLTVSNDGPVNYDSKDVRVFSKTEIAEVLDNALQVVNNYWSVWREFEKQFESNDIQMIYKMISQLEINRRDRDSFQQVNDVFGTKIDTGSGTTDIKKMINAYVTSIDNIHFNFGIYATKRSTQTVSAAISFSDSCIRAYM